MVKKDKDKRKVKIDKLKVNRETVQDLTDEEISKIKGGVGGSINAANCPTDLNCPTEYANCTVSPRADCLGKGPKDPAPQSDWCSNGCK